jgi:cytochrome c peroxidase
MRRMDSLNGLVFSSMAAIGLALTACDTPELAEFDEPITARTAEDDTPPGILAQVRAELAAHGITPIPAPPTASPELFELGEALFYDKLLSGHRDVACATCHAPQFATADARALNAGIKRTGLGPTNTGLIGGRHTQPLFNLHLLPDGLTIDGKVELVGANVLVLGLDLIPQAYQERMGFDIVNAQAIMPLVTPQEMLGFPDPTDDNELGDCAPFDLHCAWGGIMARIGAIPEYREMFAAAYPGTSWADMTIAEVGAAIGAYEYQAFFFNDSPWDRFVAGDDTALSESAIRGARYFFSANKGNCVSCHSGNALTDQQYHKTLSPMFGPGGSVPAGDGPGGLDDFGRMRNTHDPDDKYAWRTPPLRGVELTAPYGRLGQYTELADFLRHYHDPEVALVDYDITQVEMPVLHGTQLDNVDEVLANGVDPLLAHVKLQEAAIDDLVAFLHSLTDDRQRDMSALIPASVPSGLEVDQ